MKTLIFLPIIFLAGCACKPVYVPVNQPCQVPEITKPELHYTPGGYDNVFDVVRDLKGDNLQLQAYSEKVTAALDQCKK